MMMTNRNMAGYMTGIEATISPVPNYSSIGSLETRYCITQYAAIESNITMIIPRPIVKTETSTFILAIITMTQKMYAPVSAYPPDLPC